MTAAKRADYGTGSVKAYTTTAGKRWYAVYSYRDRAGKRCQRKLSGFTTANDAKKAVRAALVDRDRGKHLDPSDVTVQQYARDEYLPQLVTKQRAPITVANYTATLERWVFPIVGALPLQKVNRRDVAAIVDSMKGLSPATIRLAVTLLGALLEMAKDDDLVDTNPARHKNLVLPEQGPSTRIPWEAEEAKVFLTSLQPDRDDMDLAFWLMALTGIRRAETAGLRWGDLDLDAGLLHVQRSVSSVAGTLHVSNGKTENADRLVGLTPRAVELLARHKMREAERFWANGHTFGDESPVFATWLCGPFAPHTFSTRFQSRVKRAGVRAIPLHALRHLAISQAQHDPQVSQGMLGKVVGHSSARVTGGYTHADAEAAHKVAESIASRLLEATA